MLIKTKFKKILLIFSFLLLIPCFVGSVSGNEITIDNCTNIQETINSVVSIDESEIVNLKPGNYKLGGNSLNLSSNKLLTINSLGLGNSRPVIDGESQNRIFKSVLTLD